MKTEKLKNKAFIKAIVLRNLKLSVDCAIDKLIEEAEASEQHASPEISEDYFIIEARSKFVVLLSQQIAETAKQTMFTASQM